jgi:hypothetical protein
MTSPLPPLATVDDLTARLGRDLTSIEASRAGALLLDASRLIRRYCKRDFLYHEDDILILRADGGEIKIPSRPVISVASVIAISGREDVPDIPVTWYTFDEIDKITIMDATASGVINLPEAWYMYWTSPGTFQVTVTHGYTSYPEDVNSVCANSVISVLTAPSQASGVIGETFGPYSYRVVRSGGGVKVALSEDDMDALSDYRPKYGTIRFGGWG